MSRYGSAGGFFLHTLFNVPAATTTPDQHYLPHALTFRDRVRLLALFAAYMFTVIGFGTERTVHQLTALRWHFISRECDVEAFASKTLTAVKSGLRHQTPPAGGVPHRRLPVTLEMVSHIFHHYRSSINPEHRARATAIILGFTCLLRPSEYLCGTRTNHHCFRASQFEFECVSTDTLRTTFLTLEAVRGVPWERVRLMRINMKTAKNIPWRSGSRLWFTPQHADNVMHIVRAMYDWAQFTAALDAAAVFSWHTGNTSSTRQPSTRECLKKKHDDGRCHIDRIPLSARSL
jgi:hypothetical protein